MLLDQIQSDLKNALKEKKQVTISTLRFLIAAIHNKEIELKKRGQLTDEEVVTVVRKQAKQHRESIEAYQKGKRDDLAEKERRELAILSKYLPQKLPPKKLEKIVKQVIGEMGEVGEKDFGRVMGAAMARVKGRAEGGEVARVVKKQLKSPS